MEDSVPATAAAEENAVQEQKPAEKRRRLRVPTSVLVTLFVALLSVWVAPAFARQWDDRQKARELQAALAQEIAAVTATAIGDGLSALEPGRTLPPVGDRRSWDVPRRSWDVASLRVEATLRTYFPSLVPQWRRLGDRIVRLLAYAPDMRAAVTDVPKAHPGNSKELLAGLLSTVLAQPSTANQVTEDVFNIGSFDEDIRLTPSQRKGVLNEVYPARLDEVLRDDLLRSIEQLTNEILHDSPAGFSTSRRDLLRDLLP